MAQLPVPGYNGRELVRFGNDDWEIAPFQEQGINGIGDWDEQISRRVSMVNNNLEGLLRNRDMTGGLRTAAEILRSHLSSILQTMHTAAFRDLPRQVQQEIIFPLLRAAHSNAENFYQQLGRTPNVIEAIQAAQSGVPPSSGVIQNDQQQIPRQRRQANQINTPPQPQLRQVNEIPPPSPPPADDITWLDHLHHVVQFCKRNWKWIALGAVVGVAAGGIGAAVLSGKLLVVGAGMVGGGVGVGVGTTGAVAGVQCSRCIRGQCQDHPHQD